MHLSHRNPECYAIWPAIIGSPLTRPGPRQLPRSQDGAWRVAGIILYKRVGAVRC
jgi:hypothetical protein